MDDRVSRYPGRVKLTPVEGQENVYDMVLADEPTTEGTRLNKASLLDDATTSFLGLSSAAVPTEAIKKAAQMAKDVDTSLKNITVTGSFSLETQSSGSITKTIYLGFRPRLVLIYSKYNEGAPTVFYTDAYRHIRIIDGSGPTGSITSNGFSAEFKFKGDFAIKTLYYIAFK